MTTDQAREFADNLQERVAQMGDRTGEGHYLGQCLSVIRDLAAQVDAKTAPPPDVPAAAPPKKRRMVPVDDPAAPPRLDE